MNVDVVIPVLNEEQAIGAVLAAIPAWVRRAVVVDNGCTDRTAQIAAELGALVVREPRRGYGAACLAGLAALDEPDVVVFLDGDGSDYPEEMDALVGPIRSDEADLVIGSRVLGGAEKGALTWPQRAGNALATMLIRRLWNLSCTDLGPFRAVRLDALRRLAMDDLDYGWTVQMQARAAQGGLRIREAPVRYRRRRGKSKISGTVRGVAGAGAKILWTVGAEALRTRSAPAQRDRLVVFTRLPVPGSAKTRMIPALGADGAAALHSEMTRHTIGVARRWAETWGGDVEVRFTGGDEDAARRHFGKRVRYTAQGDGDLGERMHRAVAENLDRGGRRVVLIGSDCPELTPAVLRAAFERLRGHDAVIGPAEDGGYYLIGLKRARPALFTAVEWGTERVLDHTRKRIAEERLSVSWLPVLRDVDEPGDLPLWRCVREAAETIEDRPRLSIIIPVLNEAGRIAEAIASVRRYSDAEILVVDGGSTDETPRIAAALGANVLRAPPQRAAQMNLGAARARGRLFLFLHADTRLPFGWPRDVARFDASTDAAGLAFSLAFDAATPSLRLIEWGANTRSRLLGLPYGDQGLLVRREVFEQLGGFAPMPAMEDYEFVRRLRKLGTVMVSRLPAVTSARRWLRRGIWRTTLRHQVVIAAYHLGLSPERVAALLHGRRRPSAQSDDPTVSSRAPIAANAGREEKTVDSGARPSHDAHRGVIPNCSQRPARDSTGRQRRRHESFRDG